MCSCTLLVLGLASLLLGLTLPAFLDCCWTTAPAFCRCEQEDDGSIRLLARSRKPVAPSPICGFELSRSGELLAAVTPDGAQPPPGCSAMSSFLRART